MSAEKDKNFKSRAAKLTRNSLFFLDANKKLYPDEFESIHSRLESEEKKKNIKKKTKKNVKILKTFKKLDEDNNNT